MTPRSFVLFRLFLATLLAVAAPAFADDCDHVAPREETLDAAGVERIDVDASAGYLRITGEQGAGEVRIRGEACASSADLLEDVIEQAESISVGAALMGVSTPTFKRWAAGSDSRQEACQS